MKKNMLRIMNQLEIDEGIRDLIRQLWKHNYRTLFSCEGNNMQCAYVIIKDNGDGWFEENSEKYGLIMNLPQKDCCEMTIRNLGTRANCCVKCGAGLNGNKYYLGKLIKNPFKPILS